MLSSFWVSELKCNPFARSKTEEISFNLKHGWDVRSTTTLEARGAPAGARSDLGGKHGRHQDRARELAPLLLAGLRSLVASVCLHVWMKAKGIAGFPSRVVMLQRIVVGLLLGCESALIDVALQYTMASRRYVLVYTAPFFPAVGARFFLGTSLGTSLTSRTCL